MRIKHCLITKIQFCLYCFFKYIMYSQGPTRGSKICKSARDYCIILVHKHAWFDNQSDSIHKRHMSTPALGVCAMSGSGTIMTTRWTQHTTCFASIISKHFKRSIKIKVKLLGIRYLTNVSFSIFNSSHKGHNIICKSKWKVWLFLFTWSCCCTWPGVQQKKWEKKSVTKQQAVYAFSWRRYTSNSWKQ